MESILRVGSIECKDADMINDISIEFCFEVLQFIHFDFAGIMVITVLLVPSSPASLL